MNIIKNRYLYFLISLLVIIPGLDFMVINWVKPWQPISSAALILRAAHSWKSNLRELVQRPINSEGVH